MKVRFHSAIAAAHAARGGVRLDEVRALLRLAGLDDLYFAGDVYLKTMRYITDRIPDFDERRHMARFAERFLPDEVRIVVADGKDIGWLQVSETDDEIFLKQMFLQPASRCACMSDLASRSRLGVTSSITCRSGPSALWSC